MSKPSMLKRLFENFVLKATDWLFRVRTIERVLLNSAFGVLAFVYGSPFLIEIILFHLYGHLPDRYLAAKEIIDRADVFILSICAVALSVAIVLIVCRAVNENRRLSKKRTIVIEGRGLRDDDGSPLEQVVMSKFEGQIIPVLLDLRNRLDGEVIKPELALQEISTAHRSALQHKKNVDRKDLTTVYGGLTSVPYTFLTGVLLDDEGSMSIFDWDRIQEKWRSLDGNDDGLEFQVSGIDEIRNLSEVVVALEFSYPIEGRNLTGTFVHPIVRVTLDGMSSDAHWSQEKQNRLSSQFLETIKRLSKLGVTRIHLVIAAPNSVVFTFGRRYDKRNLPEIAVYQYEPRRQPAYPWGVVMPVAGRTQAEVVYN